MGKATRLSNKDQEEYIRKFKADPVRLRYLEMLSQVISMQRNSDLMELSHKIIFDLEKYEEENYPDIVITRKSVS